MLARITSASLVQANGLGWSFQWPVKAPVAEMSSSTGVKLPRRMAWPVMIEKRHSARFSYEQLAGAKCGVTRWFCGLASRWRTSACVCVASLSQTTCSWQPG
jgi:hypothetical protein